MIRIDGRENLLGKIFIKSMLSHVTVVKNMEMGDVIIESIEKYEKNKKYIVIERKELSDLVSSVRNGRFRAQRERMKKFRKEKNDRVIVMYIVEGDFNKNKEAKNYYYNCCSRMTIRDGIFSFHTNSIVDTAIMITKIFLSFEEFGIDGCARGGAAKNNITKTEISPQEQSIKNDVRKFKLSQDSNGLNDKQKLISNSLMTIKGVSIFVANAIAEKYTSICEMTTDGFKKINGLMIEPNSVNNYKKAKRVTRELIKKLVDKFC